MSPDSVRDLVMAEFPDLVVEPRKGGWAFFYRVVRRHAPSTRIARAVRSSGRAPTMFKPAVTARLEMNRDLEVELRHGASEVRELLQRELRLYLQHVESP